MSPSGEAIRIDVLYGMKVLNRWPDGLHSPYTFDDSDLLARCPPACIEDGPGYVSSRAKCPKCGRSSQTPHHKSCDGCGAPK